MSGALKHCRQHMTRSTRTALHPGQSVCCSIPSYSEGFAYPTTSHVLAQMFPASVLGVLFTLFACPLFGIGSVQLVHEGCGNRVSLSLREAERPAAVNSSSSRVS
jgi:hypothetical protein